MEEILLLACKWIVFYYFTRNYLITSFVSLIIIFIMERDAAIVIFIFGFLLIFWLIITVSWLVYITSKLYSLRAEMFRRISDILNELICNSSPDVLINEVPDLIPPPYRQTVV
ncbi:MAG: small hydrophobic protein [Eothenomys eva jeilongvirus]|uniref:Small hydrophobic protein n=1 Tax=Eothenomys eva jeilongvirus TaxID=3028505 RepID=A0AAT9TTY7_9MONO|nr:MAG: small hydrophobic protein [Eothenomys eva jeilongvirus]